MLLHANVAMAAECRLAAKSGGEQTRLGRLESGAGYGRWSA